MSASVRRLLRSPLARYAARQAVILLALELLYDAGRGLVPQHAATALHNGLAVVALERHLHVFDEWRLQAALFARLPWSIGPVYVGPQTLTRAIDQYYLLCHFGVTLLVLVWVLLRHRGRFSWLRDVFVATTALTLLIYLIFPMMPPRLMGAHMHLPGGYQVHDLLAAVLDDRLDRTHLDYNPYAAMPSLHFAWALIVGGGLVYLSRRPLLRAAGVVYPLVMLLVIVASANHLWLDAVASTAVVALAIALVSAWHAALNRRARPEPHAALWTGDAHGAPDPGRDAAR